MKKSFPSRLRASSALLCALLAGCTAFGRSPTAYELDPIETSSAPREPLPDEAERLAAELVTWSLEDPRESGTEISDLQVLQQLEKERAAQGQPATGLVDNALDVYNATRGEDTFREFAEEMLANGKPDAQLGRKLRSYLDSQPLRVAERRLGEQRRARVGQIVNRFVGPISRGLVGDPTAPLEAGRALIYSYAVLRSVSQASTQERQALRAYREFLQSSPGSLAAEQISSQVEQLGRKLRDQRLGEAYKAATDSLFANRPDAALIHLARADQISPEEARTASLRQIAQARLFELDQRTRITLEADPEHDSAFASLSGKSREPMVAELLDEPLGSRVVPPVQDPMDADLQDELEFITATDRLAQGDEDGYYAELQMIASRPGNMARHAANILETGEQNPYRVYRAARSARARAITRFIFIGNPGNPNAGSGALPLPLRPINFALNLPYYVLTVIGLPFRFFELPKVSAKLNGPVLGAGELYLDRFPHGAHAEEIHRALESGYAGRGQWNQALQHHQALRDPDPQRVASYRSKVAERTLEFAELEDRPLDVRMAVYASLVREYGDTDAGKKAGRELEKLRGSFTLQSIKLTRAFLVENRDVWGPGALGLRPELLDGKRDNGELGDDGVRLIGKNYVEITLADRAPLQRRISEENFVRFVSLLEEVRYRRMAGDGREQPAADPQLDAFLEQARLGLIDKADARPTARANSVMLSSGEKFPGMKRADSILPIELVVRGGLNDAGLAALPRLKIPRESADAFLYK